jgi:small-conductance mechanosensitive channel
MKALLRCLVLLVGLLAATSGQDAAAQSGPAAPPPATGPAPAAPAPAPAKRPPAATPLPPEQARDVLDTLNDPKKRAAFIATLEAMTKALPVPPPAPDAAAQAPDAVAVPPANPPEAGQEPKPDLALPLKPDSLGARLLVTASSVLAEASARAEGAVSAMNSLPSLWQWVVVMTTDPWGRGVLIDTAWRVLVAFSVGIAVEYAVRRLLRRPREALVALGARHIAADLEAVPDASSSGAAMADDHPPDQPHPPHPQPHQNLWRVSALGMLRRLPLTLGRLGLDLLPILAFLVAAHLMISTRIGGELRPRLVLIALVGAYVTCGAILAVVRALVAPNAHGLRLFDVSDDTAAYIMRWTRRIVIVSVFGYALGEAGLLLGLSDAAHDVLMKAVGLVDHVLVAIIVIEKRRAVRDWIQPAPGRTGIWAQLRARFADIWHWVALFYIVALWVVWAVEVPEGFSVVLRLLVLTSLCMVVTRFALILLHGLLDRLLTPRPETVARYPEIAVRMRMWRPVLHMLVNVVVYLITAVELLQIWGVGAIAWLTGTDLGRHVLSAVSGLVVTIVAAMAVWEVVNHGIERHLARLAREAQIARAARLRTLLPMLRTALLVTILVVVGLLVLSEIGVNIAPLLAGAGVLGIAIGFGSQKLVQDVITGLFLLLENTVQVGDVVTVGGLSGVVEDLSVRTIRLRSEDGSVHVIPFSAVTTVTNMTRDFGHAVIEVGVAYKEDYDHVVTVMTNVVTEMRQESRWKDEIRDELEVMGLNAFGESAVMIKARIKCGPFGRWSVLREFNRRVKSRFDAEGIEIPFPHQQLVLSEPIAIASRQAQSAAPQGTQQVAAQ